MARAHVFEIIKLFIMTKTIYKSLLALILCFFFGFFLHAQIQIGEALLGENMLDEFGTSVSLSADGSRLAIGVPKSDENGDNVGLVRVYEWNGGQWATIANEILGEAPVVFTGTVVTLTGDGNRIGIGAYENNGNNEFIGTVRMYDLIDDTWVQIGDDISAEAAQDEAGNFVSLSTNGNRIAVGSYGDDGQGKNVGQVQIYEYKNEQWEQIGSDIEGEHEGDKSGLAVSISADGSRIALGAPYNGNNGEYAGTVRVYMFDGIDWVQLGTDINGEAANDYSGSSIVLSADGNRIAIGAHNNDGNGINAGHVRVYDFKGTDWLQLGEDIDGLQSQELSGKAIALSADGTRIAIGAPQNEDMGVAAGQVRVYNLEDNNWLLFGTVLSGDEMDDKAGSSVAISANGDRIAIGAPFHSFFETSAGQVKIFGFTPTIVQELLLQPIQLYPNPTTDYVEIVFAETLNAEVKYKLISSNGQICMSGEIATQKHLYVGDLVPGIYYLVIGHARAKFVKLSK